MIILLIMIFLPMDGKHRKKRQKGIRKHQRKDQNYHHDRSLGTIMNFDTYIFCLFYIWWQTPADEPTNSGTFGFPRGEKRKKIVVLLFATFSPWIQYFLYNFFFHHSCHGVLVSLYWYLISYCLHSSYYIDHIFCQ